MPNWIVITPEHLDDYLVGVAMEALRETALADGQDDPFGRIMPDVAQRIRNEVAACRVNQLDPTPHSIPPETKTTACLLIIEAMQGRLPRVKLTEGQEKMLEDGRNMLRRISRCEYPVTQPDNAIPAPVQASGAVQVVSSSPRLATRRTLDGL